MLSKSSTGMRMALTPFLSCSITFSWLRLAAEKMDQCRWVKPKPVCQIAFVEWTDAGHLRHCTFVGMRDDKKPEGVVRET